MAGCYDRLLHHLAAGNYRGCRDIKSWRFVDTTCYPSALARGLSQHQLVGRWDEAEAGGTDFYIEMLAHGLQVRVACSR